MVYAYSDEERIDIDENELEKLEEHGELFFNFPEGKNLRLVYHDEDYSDENRTGDDPSAFG